MMEFVRVGAGDCDQCEFQEIELSEPLEVEDSPDVPKRTKVLLPCAVCGVTALEAMTDTDSTLADNEIAFARYLMDHFTILYHWSPTPRRKQIIRYGLRPLQQPTTHIGDPLLGENWKANYICFADTPKWAWSLSAGMRSSYQGDWDLWCVDMARVERPFVMPADWSNGIHEIRTECRVYKRYLWHVGTRSNIKATTKETKA